MHNVLACRKLLITVLPTASNMFVCFCGVLTVCSVLVACQEEVKGFRTYDLVACCWLLEHKLELTPELVAAGSPDRRH